MGNLNRRIYNLSKEENSRRFSCNGMFDVFVIDKNVWIVPCNQAFSEIEHTEKTFKHDCGSCVYLFSIDKHMAAVVGDELTTTEALKINKPYEILYDCYIYPHSDGLDYNIVIRYGDGPSSYFSGRDVSKTSKQGRLLNLVNKYIKKTMIDKMIDWGSRDE